MTAWFLSSEDVLITDFQGQLIRLTTQQWDHIVGRHGYMERMQSEVRETLEDPEEVHKSIISPNSSRLYYRWYTATEKGEKWMCVVVKFLADGAFISTAYVTDRIKAGDLIWQKEY